VSNISQSSVATHLRCGGITYRFSAWVRRWEFGKSNSIWRSYDHEYSDIFLIQRLPMTRFLFHSLQLQDSYFCFTVYLQTLPLFCTFIIILITITIITMIVICVRCKCERFAAAAKRDSDTRQHGRGHTRQTSHGRHDARNSQGDWQARIRQHLCPSLHAGHLPTAAGRKCS